MRFMVGLTVVLAASFAFSAPVFAREQSSQVCGPPFTGPPFCQPPMYDQLRTTATRSTSGTVSAPAPKSAPAPAASKK